MGPMGAEGGQLKPREMGPSQAIRENRVRPEEAEGSVRRLEDSPWRRDEARATPPCVGCVPRWMECVTMPPPRPGLSMGRDAGPQALGWDAS